MSCFLLYLGCDRTFDVAAPPHAAGGRRLPATSCATVTRGAPTARRSPPTSMRPPGPSRGWPRRAATRWPCCCPCPTCAAGRLDARGDAARRAGGGSGDDVRPGGARRLGGRRAPDDARRTSGATSARWTATRSRSSRRCTSRRTSGRPTATRRVARLYHVGGGTHPGAGIPGVLLGAEVTAGLVAADVAVPVRAAKPRPRARLLEQCPGAILRWRWMRERGPEARATTRRVARTFALACRLLPREVRDDVYLLYLVFRTLDDLVDEERAGARRSGSPRSSRVGAGGGGASPEIEVLDGPRLATRPPALGAGRLLRGHARGPGRRRLRDRGGPRPLLLPRRGHGRGRDGGRARHRAARARTAGRRGARAWRCSARTSCATSTRTVARGRVYLARETLDASAAARADARRCCATRSRGPTRSTSSGSPASASCRRGRRAIAAARRDVPRDPAPASSARLPTRAGPRDRAALAQAAVAARAAWRV